MEPENEKIKSDESSSDGDRGLQRIWPFDTSEAAADEEEDDAGEDEADNTPVYNAKEMFQQVRIEMMCTPDSSKGACRSHLSCAHS